MLYIAGHKSPDTDSIVAAIVMVDYFRKMGEEAQAVRVGEVNREAAFILNLVEMGTPVFIDSLAQKKVFLVDHNELEQAGSGIEEAEIIGILDHHKLGGIKTPNPIYVQIEPIGSTSTLIYKLFKEKDFPLTKTQAFLLLGGIISDTLKFTSPTTTAKDRKAAEDLAEFAGQNIDELARKMFEAKSDITGMSLKDLISADYKEYKEKDALFGVSVHETTLADAVLKKKKQILDELENFKKERKADLMFFGVVDIFKQQTHLFVIGEKEKAVAEKAFERQEKDDLMLLPGIVSRKKQMVPAIIEAL